MIDPGELSRARAQTLNRLHRLFLELLPGGAPTKKSTAQYKALLATVRPRDPVGRMRRRIAAAEVADRLPGIFEDHDLVGPEDDALQEMARSMRQNGTRSHRAGAA
ncbi:MAG: transposase, partial [Kribbellaceae bacterium]|nr:transposase [Kribbellaceae bacterium]